MPICVICGTEFGDLYFVPRGRKASTAPHAYQEIDVFPEAILEQICCDRNHGLYTFNIRGPKGFDCFVEDLHDMVLLTRAQADKLLRYDTCRRGLADRIAWYNTKDVVTVDGCCIGNHLPTNHPDRKAGFGVVCHWDQSLNLSDLLLSDPQTNQRAEVVGATDGARKVHLEGYCKARIGTDSQYTMDGMTKWAPKWKRNGWTGTSGPVVYQDVFRDLDEACRGLEVEWEHVLGHSGDPHQEEADRLAKSGARSTR